MTLAVSRALADDVVALRRALHREPELGLHLPVTQRLILEALAGLDIDIHTGTGLSSVVGVIRGGATGPGPRQAVLLRGDMDALPVTEDPSIDYASRRPGLMHACGHDLHVAALVGAARLLHDHRTELTGDVVLMFQPGEEGPGGASIMLDEGILEVAGSPVVAAYALHVASSGQPLGTWFGRPGPLMAAADECVITVRGEGGHGSQPHMAKDPVPVACEIVLALQLMVTRRFDAMDPVVVTVGKVAAGTKDNIIPDDAVLEATIRTFSADNREKVRGYVETLAAGIASAHGLGIEVVYRRGYPVTLNHPREYAFLRETIVDLFGDARYAAMEHPEAGAEDFAFISALVPSAYVFLSACPSPQWATAPDNHSPRAQFDDSVLADAALLLAEAARRRLAVTGPPSSP